MVLMSEQIRQEAHTLAMNHDPIILRRASKSLWKAAESDLRLLRSFAAELREHRTGCYQPAEEWLLDNAEFIEEQFAVIRQELSEAMLSALPHLRKSGEARIFSICKAYLDHTEGQWEEEALARFLEAYQEVSVLTMAELWCVPLLMRLAMLRRLAEKMEEIREGRNLCIMVERIMDAIPPGEMAPETLGKALNAHGYGMPLSGTLVAHLIKHLREREESSAAAREWLVCMLENGPESHEQILRVELQMQAANQVFVGNLVSGLRRLSRVGWQETFERISLVERTLRKEKSGDYVRLDFASRESIRRRVEHWAKRMRVPENLIAEQAVELADRRFLEYAEETPERPDGEGSRIPPRDAFVAYYLLDPEGVRQLRASLKKCSRPRAIPGNQFSRRAAGTYFFALFAGFSLMLALFALWTGAAGFTRRDWLLTLAAAAFPALEWAVFFTHWLISFRSRPIPLLRYDFASGVPAEAATVVAVPVIWSSPEEVEEMAEKLELHHLSTRSDHVYYALLGDFRDSARESMPEDAAVVERARSCIRRLNRTYGKPVFFLFQRKRTWNESEQAWMGWERKRGKLVEFVEWLKGGGETGFQWIEGDAGALEQLRQSVRYIITLDADTQLTPGSAQRMIGTMHLPYNRPRFNRAGTRVVEGYGVLQPRIGISHEASHRTRWAWLWSFDPGVDPYAFAMSDPYQDGMGQGIFTGKGIFDVDAFARALCRRIPCNRVLSHDLLEGGFLRAGLLSDIELIDDHPARLASFQQRLHRWIRGDWQLLMWLMPRVRNRQGKPERVDLSPLTRWQMVDNMRRSLLPPALLALAMLSFTVLPGSAGRWIALFAATWFLPAARELAAFVRRRTSLRHVGGVLAQTAVGLALLPYQCALHLDAIFRTLYRLLITKKHLLEWISSADAERSSMKQNAPLIRFQAGGLLLIALFLACVLTGSAANAPGWRAAAAAVSALWAGAPLLARWLERPPGRSPAAFNEEETADLRKLASDIWSFYEDYVTGRDNWLPPDNVQMDPPNGIAHRTSPTNIGLYLACCLAARDFGFLSAAGMIERLERTVATIEKMEKWRGHLLNWYDTETLAPLHPRYVSTVDSGNLVCSLITVKEGLREWLEGGHPLAEDEGDGRWALDRRREVAFAEEISPELPEKTAAERADAVPFATEHPGSRRGQDRSGYGGDGGMAALRERGRRLVETIERLIGETDFRPLFDPKTKMFSLGYHPDTDKRDEVLYDLLASEARQASFAAIALGQVPVSHWHALGRTMTMAGRQPALLSWSGTMFEYLMPWLFMKTYSGTIWDRTYEAVVQWQQTYADSRGVPFGISESGYYAFDYQMNYQYRAFGVPGLGFQRGLELDLVVSPYAAILAMGYARSASLRSLKRMEELGARGKYGYYEAIDFTPERMPRGKEHMVIRSFMAHHQGMSLLALANLLLPRAMYDRFHRDKRVRSMELLLQERLPRRPRVIEHPAVRAAHKPVRETAQEEVMREFTRADTPLPAVCVLSNGAFSTVVSNSGSGFMRFRGSNVSRWREDPVAEPWGNFLYIRDVGSDAVWSPFYLPCRTSGDEHHVQFFLDKAVFARRDGDVHTRLEICVTPEWNADVRRLTLTNLGRESRMLEVTSFVELALSRPVADEAHPAFNKLFVRTGFHEESGCLVAGRRPREADGEPLWAAHGLFVEGGGAGPLEYETDRAAFIGRGGTLADPAGLRARLRLSLGSVADPAFVMRRQIILGPGEERQLYVITAAGRTREEAVETASRLNTAQAVERAFQLAWNWGRIELAELRLSSREAMVFQTLAGQILYAPPFSEERKQAVAGNVKGQSGLWPFGISGDLPIVLAAIGHRSHLPFVLHLLAGHEYLRRRGIDFDLVILNESEGGYQQDVQGAVQRAVEHGGFSRGKEGGVVRIIPANRLGEEDIRLFQAAARVSFRADGPSIKAQIRPPKPRAALPETLVPSVPAGRFAQEASRLRIDTEDWLFFNQWGGFSPDGREYRIVLKNGHHLPAPWINVIANPQFGFLFSELGTGYTWWLNSRECKLTPWSNDPVLDPPGEAAFARDEESGEWWTLAPGRGIQPQPYVVAHGRGYSRVLHERHGIRQETVLFVPLEDPVKIVQVKLRNLTPERRRLSLTYYAEWVIGVSREAAAPHIVAEWMEGERMLVARNTYQDFFRDAHAFLAMDEQALDDPRQMLSWTTDRGEFIGRGRSLDDPAAMYRTRLSGSTGPGYSPCGAVRLVIELMPGEEKTVCVLLGCERSAEAARELVRKYRDAGERERALREVEAYWEETLGQMVVSTPCREMDVLLNGWLLYQTLACRMWARTAFYQAGGAYGYRDQLQDSLALMHVRPELTRKQILLHAAHQYAEGDVQHWWHEETARGIRTKFSDDLLWLPYVVSRYVEHTGDETVLDEIIPFLASEPLGEEEHERYEETVPAEVSASVYEHCLRAIDLALGRFGEHGLPKIGTGDWNDGMSLVGAKGRGESVWLGWFLCDVLARFAAICDRREPDRAAEYRGVREQLERSLDEHAWDGQWYRRAFTDSGTWLGSVKSGECRIDAIAQSWSAISGAAPFARALQAMHSFDRELVERDIAVARLLFPAFDETEPSPGYIQGYPPGIRENGAQYTHGAIWSIIAWAVLGRGDKAFELFQLINPLSHTRTDSEVRMYKGEPYVIAADVYTAEPHVGRAGWTWYTGAAGWMYQAGVEWILGLRRFGSRLSIRPCIPPDWPRFSVRYRYGSSNYLIEVRNPGGKMCGPGRLVVDGREVDAAGQNPDHAPYVELTDDGQEHVVEWTLLP